MINLEPSVWIAATASSAKAIATTTSLSPRLRKRLQFRTMSYREIASSAFPMLMRYSSLLLSLMLVGCSTPPTVKSWLDPVSSATITAQTEPLVLSRIGPTREISERDYAQLVAVEVNRMGDRRLYLIAVLWSTANLSGQQWQDFESDFTQIELNLDGRSVTLTRHVGELAALGIGQMPLPLPIPGSHHVYFPIERAQLRTLAESKHVQLNALGGPRSPQRYEEWKDGRQSLSDFLSRLPSDSASTRQGAASRQSG
jgi:hypothetical protein